MKNRALRRHQQRVAQLRHIRIIWRSSPWRWDQSPNRVLPDPDWACDWRPYQRKPWQQVSRCTMNGEPKHWQQAFNLRPSRIRQNQLLRHIERGRDPDVIPRWPDYRKPHIYYW